MLKYPDPRLHEKAAPVVNVDEEVRSLIFYMTETMYHENGIGLAATQVGINKRVIVLDIPPEREDEDEQHWTEDDTVVGQGGVHAASGGKPRRGRGSGNLLALINPEIVESNGETKHEEGCLSVPGFTAEVPRAPQVVVKGLDVDGNDMRLEAEGLFAAALQHEIDHLDGILFIDRLSRLKRTMIKKKIEKSLEAEELAL